MERHATEWGKRRRREGTVRPEHCNLALDPISASIDGALACDISHPCQAACGAASRAGVNTDPMGGDAVEKSNACRRSGSDDDADAGGGSGLISDVSATVVSGTRTRV